MTLAPLVHLPALKNSQRTDLGSTPTGTFVSLTTVLKSSAASFFASAAAFF